MSIDVRTWEDSSGTDFEREDYLRAFVELSPDGIDFERMVLIPEHTGGEGSGDPNDMLKSLDNGPAGAFTTFIADVPDEAATFRVVVEGMTNSGSERIVVDNISVTGVTMVLEPSTVVGRHVFYNDSSFDGDDPVANAADDAAIATDKSALSAGNPATFENYTNFDGGINGIIIDLQDAINAENITLEDLEFHVGNDEDLDSWDTAPTPIVAVRPDEGTGGSARITIVWPDGSIKNQWLEVTVKATFNTGLEEPDVFYFGNAVGDVGNSAYYAVVDDADFNAVGANYPNPAEVENIYDINRDGQVDPTDAVIVRTNYTAGGEPMTMLWAPVPEPSTLTLAAFGLLGLLAFRRRR